MRILLADAGPLVALCNPRDQHHRWAAARYAELHEGFITCEAVISEAMHLLEDTVRGAEKLRTLWRRGRIRVNFAPEEHRDYLLGLMSKYADLPMSLADACLVRMSEVHADRKVWTCDKHFRHYRRHGRSVVPVIAPWQS